MCQKNPNLFFAHFVVVCVLRIFNNKRLDYRAVFKYYMNTWGSKLNIKCNYTMSKLIVYCAFFARFLQVQLLYILFETLSLELDYSICCKIMIE